jgi:hypothetical protein
MPVPIRLANKTIWALEEIVAGCLSARSSWRICQDRAQRTMDPLLLAKLGSISDDLARIETTAREARQGRYTETE